VLFDAARNLWRDGQAEAAGDVVATARPLTDVTGRCHAGRRMLLRIQGGPALRMRFSRSR
jgi:hypothetical protein